MIPAADTPTTGRDLFEALQAPTAIAFARKGGATVAACELVYYAVSVGFCEMYAPVFLDRIGKPSTPEAWRGLHHVAVFPELLDPEHEWAVQMNGALTGTSTGWVDVAWSTPEDGVLTVAYQLTYLAPGVAGIEVVDLAGHARRVLDASRA